jgi:hypothetical protein
MDPEKQRAIAQRQQSVPDETSFSQNRSAARAGRKGD